MAKETKALKLTKRQTIGLAIFLLALVVLFVFVKYIGTIRDLDLKIAGQLAAMEKPTSKGKGRAPSEIDALREEIKSIKKQHEALSPIIEATPLKLDPDVVASEGDDLYFRQKMYELVQRLKRQNLWKKMNVQENLGFGEGVPPKDQVGPMLRQLKLTEQLIVVLLEEGALNIQTIKPQPLLIKKSSVSASKTVYREMPVRVIFTSDIDTLVGLLYRLESESPIYLVRELSVKSLEKGAAPASPKGALKSEMLVSLLTLE